MEKLMKTAGVDCVTTTNCSFLEVGIKLVSLSQVKSLSRRELKSKNT